MLEAGDYGLDPAGARDAVNRTAFGKDGRVLHFEASDDPLVQLPGVERMDAVNRAPLSAVGAHGAVLLLNSKDGRKCTVPDRARHQGEGESRYGDETPPQSGHNTKLHESYSIAQTQVFTGYART